jgi:hypothetical protein
MAPFDARPDMHMRVDVKPAMLRWARERAGMTPNALVRRFPQARCLGNVGRRAQRLGSWKPSPRLHIALSAICS